MRVMLLVLCFSLSAFAQNMPSVMAPACGTKGVSFEVTLNAAKQAPPEAQAGKARVYFIQNDGPGGNHQHYTVKVAVDGSWVGAYRKNSYLAVSVTPGEHHFCANVQSDSSLGKLLTLAQLRAEAGKSYYFQTQFLAGMNTLYPTYPYLDLRPIDSDEGRYLVDTLPLSVWKLNK